MHQPSLVRAVRRAVSLTAAAVVLVLSSAYVLAPSFGAEVTNRKDTLSTSAPGADANHELVFTIQDTWSAGETLILQVDPTGDAFNLSGLVAADFDVLDDGTNQPVVGTCGAATNDISVSVNTTTDEITFTRCTGEADITSGSVVTIRIGTNAVNDGTGSNQINNPAKVAAAGTADIYTIRIAGDFGGSGDILVAIQDQVTVSVTVDESLTFTIAGETTGSNCAFGTDDGTGTTVTSGVTATAIPFGTVSTEAFYKACQNVSLSTNASGGFTLTGEENTNLRTSGGTNIPDSTCDASSCTESTFGTWATATNNGLAHSCRNVTGTACASGYDSSGAFRYRQFACRGSDAQCDPGTGGETAQTIMSSSGPTSTVTGRIHYKLSVDGSQAAGAYTNTVTYIATPTF